MIKKIKVSELKANKENPRTVSKEKFSKLKKSIKHFPKMLKLRPIVIDDNNTVLGGNMRLKALKSLGIKETWCIKASDLNEEEKEEFIIKDNVGFGDWDWELLANQWNYEDLEDWGLDLKIEDLIDGLEEDEEIEIQQSVQLEPPKEYIIILCEPNSVEWEQLKMDLQLKLVRKGGYKKGSSFDAVSTERVLTYEEFKKRYDNSNTE